MVPLLCQCIIIETLKSTKYYDETMKMPHGFEYQHCEPELNKTTSYTTAGPDKDNHQDSTNYIKLHIEAVFESEA